jgi:hypothetical protein
LTWLLGARRLLFLTELARDRRTQAVIALERALREVGHEEEWLFDAE